MFFEIFKRIMLFGGGGGGFKNLIGTSEKNININIFCFQACLSFPQSVGIVGGKPNHAHWFVGYMSE